MAKDLNKVQVIGRLGADPEVRMTNEGNTVTTFRVASSRTWRKADGETGEETEWFRVVAWNKLAEVCAKFLRKGSRIYIEGRLKTRSWQDDSGQTRYITEVIADDMIMLDSKNTSMGGGDYGDSDVGYSDIESEPAPARQSAAPARRAPAPTASNSNGGSRPTARPASTPAPAPRRPVATVEDDEDLPF